MAPFNFRFFSRLGAGALCLTLTGCVTPASSSSTDAAPASHAKGTESTPNQDGAMTRQSSGPVVHEKERCRPGSKSQDGKTQNPKVEVGVTKPVDGAGAGKSQAYTRYGCD